MSSRDDRLENAVQKTARLFFSGGSQAVRLPEEFRFDGAEVAIKRVGKGVLLYPIGDPWSILEEALCEFEPGFTIEREQPPEQERHAPVAPRGQQPR
jgi:antitoxin VapB